jgi:hypothetical protein
VPDEQDAPADEYRPLGDRPHGRMDVSYCEVGAARNSPVLRRHRRPAGRGERLGHRPHVHPVERRTPEPTVHDDQQRPLDRIRSEPDVRNLLLVRAVREDGVGSRRLPGQHRAVLGARRHYGSVRWWHAMP